jgi:hypothetical protein
MSVLSLSFKIISFRVSLFQAHGQGVIIPQEGVRMSTFTLYRASGLALLLGAVLFIIGLALAFVFNTATPLGLAMAGVWTSGLVLLLLGLPGIVARQASPAGWLGLVGFILTFSGAFLTVSYFAVIYLAILPWLASHCGSRY